MRGRLFLLMLWVISLSAWAELHTVSWVEGDLDGDGKPERAMIVSAESPDPSRQPCQRELRIYKRKGGQFQQVYQLPIEDRFSTEMADFQLQDPETLPWGLCIRRGKPPRLYVVFAPNSGHVLILRFDGKTYQIESTGD